MKLVWTNEALNRLSEIDAYISQDNIGRAQNFVNKLINTQAHGLNLKLLLVSLRLAHDFPCPFYPG